MDGRSLEFGFFPRRLELAAGDIRISPLPNFAEVQSELLHENDLIDNDWLYAPLQRTRDLFCNGTRLRPYSSRIFGLPKTHLLTHAHSDDRDQLTFLVWALSLFTGIRLTTEEAGFLDATPITQGKLVDYHIRDTSLVKAIELAEEFWNQNVNHPRRAQRFAAAIHSLFLGQNPQLLQFEQFIYAYTALDACFAIAKEIFPLPREHLPHANRLSWMCNTFGVPVPAWAKPQQSEQAKIATVRNDALHEGLFFDQPFGFAIQAEGFDTYMPQQMSCLCTRLLIAIIGASDAEYINSTVDSRQMHLLDLT